MNIEKRLSQLEGDQKEKKPYLFYSVWLNSKDKPKLYRNASAELIGYFRDEKHYQQFKDEAEQCKTADIIVFPHHWAGIPKPLKGVHELITGWSDDFSTINTESYEFK